MTEDIKTNPADLVPFVENPDPTPTQEELKENQRWAEKEAGFNPDEEPDYPKMFDGFAQMRSLIDSIPTPGQDAGDTTGSFSGFALAKDVLSGTLGLMEAPLRGVIPEEVMEDTLKMGAGAAGINIARGGAAGASAGMFGARPSPSAGRHIHDAFNTKIKRAQELEELAKDPKWREDHNVVTNEDIEMDIWKETGLSKDHRGEWRYSVMEDIENPGQARINWENYDRDIIDPYTLPEAKDPLKLGDVLITPKAYEHWPELKNVNFVSDPKHPGTGSYNPLTNTITVNPIRVMERDDPNQTLRVLVHEAQHALQNMQDRPQGAGTAWIAKTMDDRIAWFKKWKDSTKENYRTNTELAAIRKFDNVVAAWDRMQRTFSREMAAYWASPGEIEARLAEAMAASPKWIGKSHPDAFEAKNAASSPDKDNIFEPEDIDIPTVSQPVVHGTTDGKKKFGTRGVSASHPMDDPDFDSLPEEVKSVLLRQMPENMSSEEIFAGKVIKIPKGDNYDPRPEHVQLIMEHSSRMVSKYRQRLGQLLRGRNVDPERFEAAQAIHAALRKAEATVAHMEQLTNKSSRRALDQ